MRYNFFSHTEYCYIVYYRSVVECSTLPSSGRVYKASAAETVDYGSIPGRVKPKTRKIGIHSFSA